MKHLKQFFTTIAFVIVAISANAQTVNITDASIEMAGNGPTFTGTYYVTLSDTNNVSQIEVQIGTHEDLTDLLNQTFNYDVVTGLPTGFTYQREKMKLTLGVGTFIDKNTFFGRVRVKDTNENWSAYYQFITN